MKKERKPKTPIIAAHSAEGNGEKPAASNARNTGTKARGSAHANSTDRRAMSSLPEQNPNPVMRFTRDGDALYANTAAASLLDFSVEKPVPDDWRDLIRSTFESGLNAEVEIKHQDKVYAALFVPMSEAGYVNIYCREITAQKQMQVDLRKSEERFRQAADAAGALVYEVDLVSGATTVIHGMQRLAGYDPYEVEPSSEWWHSLIHPEDLPGHLAQLDELLRNGGTDVCEYRLQHRNGNWINLQDSRLVLQNETGQNVRLIGTLIDITERKQVEESLRAQEAELQDVIDQTPFMLTRCTRDLRYRFVSRGYAQMIGRKPEEVAGRPILEIMGEAGWKSISPYVEKVLQGERVEYESQIAFEGVGIQDLHVIYSPDVDAQGNVIGWFASIMDVTERNAAEQERIQLLQSEQQQRVNAEQAQLAAERATAKAEHELSERKLAEQALGIWADAPLSQEARPAWMRYGIALAATMLAVLLRAIMDPILGDGVQFTTILGAIAFSVWYGGVGPALLSMLVGYLGVTWLTGNWQVLINPTTESIWSVAILATSSAIIMSLGESMQRAQRHAHWSARVAVKRQREAEFRIQEQQRVEIALRESEQRFREIFEAAGVSVWVEDFTDVKAMIEELRSQGMMDFRSYFVANPELVRQAIGMVRILDVNHETLHLFGASSKDELLGSLHTIFSPETEQAFLDEMIVLAEGKDVFRSETPMRTLDGRTISVMFTVHFSSSAGNYDRVIVTLTDITARKQMEQALRTSEEKYRRIVETANEGIWEIDRHTNTVFANPRMAELLGYTVDELVGRSSFDFVFPEDTADGEHRLERARQGVPSSTSEFRFRRKDGSSLWALVSSSPELDEHGNFLGSVAMIVDITERKKIEQELARERELFKRLFETMPVMSTIYDPETASMQMNAHLEKLSGWKAEEVNVVSLLEALYPDPDYMKEVLGRMAAAVGRNEWVEVKMQTRDGRTLDTLWSNISIMDGEKLVTGISLGIDITERKRMEDAIRESEERYRAIVSQTTAGIAESDLESGLTFVNPRFCEMLGYSESELLGKTIWELTYTEDLEQNQRFFKRMLEAGEAYQFEKRFIRKDGSHLWTNVSVSPVHDISGKPRGGVGVIIDIEERKRAEQSIIDYARQQAALFTLAERLQHSYTPDEIYGATLDVILDALQCDRASILLFDDTDRMRFVAWRGLSDAYRQATDGHSPWKMDDTNVQPIYFNDVDTAELSDELKIAIREQGIGSLAFIPLVPNGRLIGKFMVYFDEPHNFSEAEIDLSLTIARQLAFDIARKRAEERLRWSSEYDAFRVTLADTLRLLKDPAEIQTAAMRILGEHLPVDRVIYMEVDEDAQVAVITDNHVRDGVPKVVGRIPLSEYAKTSEILRSGRQLVLSDIAASSELSEVDKASFAALGVRSSMAVPVIKDGRWVAAFGVHHNSTRMWTEQEIALLEATAERTWSVLERARSQEALRASESLYRAISRSIPGGGVYVVDRDMRYLVAEGPVTEAFGLSREMLEGRTVSEVFPDERGARMEARLQRNFAGEIVDFETSFNGRVFWTQQAPLYDSIGQAIIVTVDITERKRAEDALRSSEERMRLAIESHRMVAWEWDVTADIVTTSANFHDVYGLTEVSTIADGFALIWPEDLPAHREKVDQVMRSGGEYHSEFRITRPADGHVLWMEERATAIMDADGKVTRLVGIVIDVTERKQAEESLRMSEQRLRLATEAAGMFAWDADLSNGTLHWSDNAAVVIGCRPEDLPVDVSGIRFFVAPEDEERVQRDYADALEQHKLTYTTEFRGHGDREPARHFLVHARVLYDIKEQPIRVLGVTQDITARKHAEKALREARERAEQTAERIAKLQEITSALAGSPTWEQLSELILEQGTRASGAAAGVMVEVIDHGNDIKTVAALGYPPDMVRTDPVPLSAKTPMSDAIQARQAVWLRSYAEFAEQYPSLAETRHRFESEATVALPLIVGERVVGGLAFSFVEKRDFLLEERGFLLAVAQQCAQGLERIRATEALRESEQRFAGFMQHLPGLAWIKDIQGRYMFANDAAEKAFRVPRSELYGRVDVDVFPPHIAEQFRKNDEEALHAAKGIQVIEELEREDGSLRYSLVNKFPILGLDGAITMIGGIAIDITESKQAEERLTLLSAISELTRDSDDAEELMSAIADAVGRHLRVKRCLFNEIDVENDVEVVHHDYHDGVDSVAGVHRVTDYSSLTSAEMTQGITVVNHDSKTDPRTAQDYERSYLPNGERAYMAVPLMRDGRWAASLWVSDDKPRQWTDEDVALLQTIAERTWTACEKLRIVGELRDSEERLRVTFNTTAVGFAMLTPDTRFVDVNQAFSDIVGYSREELLTMNFDYLTHPDYVKSTRDHVRRLLRGKVPSSVIEKLYIRKDGSQVWVQNHMSLVRDVDGDPLHLIIISQDISERKQFEALQLSATQSLLAAAEANAKFRTFFDQGSYFAGVMLLDGTLVEANRLCLDFCGFTREDVIGKKFWDCGWWSPSPVLMEMVRKGIQEALAGKTFRQESPYYIADGSVRFIDLIIAPIKDENGRILFLAPTGTDITDRKHAEEELRQLNLLLEERVEKRTLQLETSDQLRRMEMLERRQAQDRFGKSFNASPAAMTITRFEDGMYRNVNPRFIELLGYDLEEVIGRTTLDLRFYNTPEERSALLKTIRNNNGKWEYETKLETKTGKLLEVSISVVEIELDGEPHILSMIMDITERNQILAALRASEQQLRTLFDVLPVGISYVSQDGKVIETNRTLEKILDITREGLQSGLYRSRQYIRPDGTPMPASEFASTRALTEQRTINNVETGIIKDGGQVIWTSVSATPISMPEPGVVVITVDVTERKHMDDELRRSHRRYQVLSQRLVEIQEEERRTISRELHDRVGQSLAALNLNLNFLNGSLSGTTSLPIKSRLKDAIQLTEETVSTIRDVMADLRPPALDDYGLEAALNAYVDPFSRRFGIRVALVKPANPIPRMNPNIELTLLRIAQEALTNVARHANAKQATVTLLCQNNMVYLTIEDNGEGIRSWQKANRPGSHGLKIMRERAETFGGTLQVQSFSKKGTKIEVKIPMQGNDQSRSNGETN